MVRTSIAACATMLLLVGAARADTVYTFVETGLSGAWQNQYQSSPVTLSFQLSDAAVAKGSFSMTQLQAPFWQSGSSGLKWLSATAPNLSVAMGPDGSSVFSMSLTFGANGQITSSKIHVDTYSDTDYVNFSGSGNRATGAYYTDSFAIPGCYTSAGSCTASGHWSKQNVPVPEPSSFGLLAAGLFGFLALRRRKAA